MLLLLAAAVAVAEPVPTDAIAAEHAFAADAQRIGQWSAFRKWAGFAGVMFVPQAVNAQRWLSDKKDPPKSVRWWPAQSFVSCDGKTAFNVGPWTRPDASFGYFTTVWILEEELEDGPRWLWSYDTGDTTSWQIPAPPSPVVRRASCANIPARAPGAMRYNIPSVPSPDSPEAQQVQLNSRDRSILYDYAVEPSGARSFQAYVWNGRDYAKVLDQHVAAPAQ